MVGNGIPTFVSFSPSQPHAPSHLQASNSIVGETITRWAWGLCFGHLSCAVATPILLGWRVASLPSSRGSPLCLDWIHCFHKFHACFSNLALHWRQIRDLPRVTWDFRCFFEQPVSRLRFRFVWCARLLFQREINSSLLLFFSWVICDNDKLSAKIKFFKWRQINCPKQKVKKIGSACMRECCDFNRLKKI